MGNFVGDVDGNAVGCTLGVTDGIEVGLELGLYIECGTTDGKVLGLLLYSTGYADGKPLGDRVLEKG